MAPVSKERKAAYDRVYRKRNKARIKANHAAYFKLTYDPAKAAIERKKRMPRHVEYCRQPRYKAYKVVYDISRRASKFGAFSEAYLLLKELKKEIKRQEPNRFERYRQSGRGPWNHDTQKRRREDAKRKQEEFLKSLGLNGL